MGSVLDQSIKQNIEQQAQEEKKQQEEFMDLQIPMPKHKAIDDDDEPFSSKALTRIAGINSRKSIFDSRSLFKTVTKEKSQKTDEFLREFEKMQERKKHEASPTFRQPKRIQKLARGPVMKSVSQQRTLAMHMREKLMRRMLAKQPGFRFPQPVRINRIAAAPVMNESQRLFALSTCLSRILRRRQLAHASHAGSEFRQPRRISHLSAPPQMLMQAQQMMISEKLRDAAEQEMKRRNIWQEGRPPLMQMQTQQFALSMKLREQLEKAPASRGMFQQSTAPLMQMQTQQFAVSMKLREQLERGSRPGIM
ncbi:MAG: hypothetical protein K6F52_06885 [Clostridia bacterium]|nr:hypothetical protein [Clostridia bacterium]